MKTCAVCSKEFDGRAQVCSKTCRTKRTRENARKYRAKRREAIIARGLPEVMKVAQLWADRKTSKEAVFAAGSHWKVPRRRFEPAMLQMWRERAA